MNFCTRCGAKLIQGDAYCRQCGACVGSQSQPAPNTYMGKTSAARHRGRKKLMIPLMVLMIVALGSATVFGYPYVKNSAVKTVLSSSKYFNYVMDDQTDKLSKDISMFTETLKESVLNENGIESKIELAVGDGLIGYCEDLFDVSLGNERENVDWIKNIKLSTSQHKDDSSINASASLAINNKDIISVNAAMDLNSNKYFFTVPEINQTALMVDMGNELYGEEVPFDIEGVYEMLGAIPEQDTAEDWIHDYFMTAIKEIDEVKESKAKLRIGDTSQKCTALKAKINADTCGDIMEAVLNKARNDETLKNIIETFSAQVGYNPNEAYNSFVSEIDETLSYGFDDISMSEPVAFTVYVDAKGKVIGMAVNVDDDEIRYVNILDGKEFASEFTANIDGEELRFDGNGVIKGSKCESDYILSLGNEDLLSIHMDDVNVLKLHDGCFEGSVTVQLSKTLLEEADIDNPALLSQSKIRYTSVKADKKENKCSVSLVYNDNELISLNIDTNKIADANTNQIPTDYAAVDDDDSMYNWLENSDFNSMLDNLEYAGAHGGWLKEFREELN